MKLQLVVLLILCVLSSAFGAILGVDYGQQFTKSVLLAPGISFEIVLTDEGKRKDFSGISLRGSSPELAELERVYGSQIGSLCTRFPQSCITGIKPLLGKSINDQVTLDYLSNHFGVKLLPDESRSNGIKFDLGFVNQSYQFVPEEIMAMNLNEIKQRALGDLDANPHAQSIVEDITVSVSPFATHETKQSYLDAIKLANFSNPLGLVDEGTAVALNYLSNRKFDKSDFSNQKIYNLVYDAGAGSTTATLFSYNVSFTGKVTLEIESIGYDESFGGQLLTQSIYNILYEKFLQQFNIKDADDVLPPKVASRLQETAERAKIILSVNADFQVSLENFYDDKDFKTVVTREEFEDINSDLMSRSTSPILTALRDCPSGPKSVKDLQSVILNGGSTRVPFIQKHLSQLLGDDKISKTVNADESCALGTTLQGLKLKTQLENQKEIKLIERSFHNYETSIDNMDSQSIVFKSGDVADNSTKVPLADMSDKRDELSVNLYEDGHLIKSYEFKDLQKKIEKFTCSKNSDDIKEISGVFTLDHNKMFDLTDLYIECKSSDKQSGGFFKKLLNKDGEDSQATEDEEAKETDSLKNETSSNSTITKSNTKSKQPKPLRIPLVKPAYPHVKPLSRTTKDRLFSKLAYLNAKDEERIILDHVRNILEGQCYELRSHIEDNEEAILKEISENELEAYQQFVRDTIEWLDFDSDNASLEELREKIRELNQNKKKLDSFIEMNQTDLSLDGFKKLYEEGSKIVMQIQSHMLEFGSEVSEIRQKYEGEGFAFDKENDRIKLQLLSKGDENKMMALDKNLATYREDLTEIGDLTGKEKKFNKLSKFQLYEKYDSLAQKIVQMLADVKSIEESHKARVGLFNAKFEKLLARKKQKEYREKLKEEKKANTKKDEEEQEGAGFIEDDDIEEVNSQTTQQQSSESSTEGEKSTESPVHDEL